MNGCYITTLRSEFPMTIERVHRGDPLSAACQNELIDQVNALGRPGTAGEAQYGSGGITFFGPRRTPLAIFQLLEELNYPNLTDAPSDHFDREPTAYATAQMVWCQQFQATDVAPDGQAVRSYGGSQHSAVVTIWHPCAPCNAAGYAVGPSPFAAGSRVVCQWDRQSGRWEILGDGPPWVVSYAKVQAGCGYTNFGMMAGFCQNSTSVPVMLCDADGSNEVGGVMNLPLPSLGDTCSVPPSRSPALFPGDVIKLGRDQTGQWTILDYGAHIDDAGGTVRMQIYAQIPRGWSAYALMTDRMPIGAGGQYAPEWTGGGIYPDHRHALDTTTFGTAWVAAGNNVNALTSVGQVVATGDEEPMPNPTPPYLEQPPTYMPPYCPLQFIQRSS